MTLWQCHLPDCDPSCQSEEDLLAHFHQVHALPASAVTRRLPPPPPTHTHTHTHQCRLSFITHTRTPTTHFRFASNEEFEAWFEVHAVSTRTSFTKDQSWPSAEGYHVTWRCDRSARRGHSAPAPEVRPARGKPSIKGQSACTCTVKTTTYADASVLVSVTSLHTHWRGVNDLRNSSLSSDTKSFVANLVSIGLSDKAIMRLNQANVLTWERRDDFDISVTRDILLTRQVPPISPHTCLS
jgi:hypothetical protein